MNTKQPLTRKQHFVPRMYLKRWQCYDVDERVFVISKRRKYSEPILVSLNDKLFYRDYCYDVTDFDGKPITSNEVEEELSRYENKHNRLLDRMIQNCENGEPVLDKGNSRLEDFLEFITLLVIRNPSNTIPFILLLNSGPCSTSTSELDKILREVFKCRDGPTGLQIAANISKGELLFQIMNYYKTLEPKPKIYFFKSTKDIRFVTSDNPVLVHDSYSYVPLSPKYASLLLFGVQMEGFKTNRVNYLNNNDIRIWNKQYWPLADVCTVVSSRKRDLIKSLQ